MSNNRSVNDFDTTQGLRSALKCPLQESSFDDIGRDFPRALVGSSLGLPRDDDSQSECSTVFHADTDLDWMLRNHDEENSNAQTLDEELRRLEALKSYMILDSVRESRFERITGLASRVLRVPIALVSLVDLGRQWFMSNRGLGDCRETPRRIAFCAHAIISKDDLLIVPDATKDPRFKDSPLVLGPPFIRFYGGAPLLSPEGFRLGTLCVIDTVVRPEGLSLEERQTLRELAALVMDAMVERRREKLSILQDNAKIIATTAHDLLTPLSGVQMSLSMLMDDENFKQNSNGNQQELISMASACADIMNRVCCDAIDAFRNDLMKQNERFEVRSNKAGGLKAIKVVDFVNNLKIVLESFPKFVPFYISVDNLVPSEICVADDLKVFRSAMNYLTNALQKTERGSVHLKIFVGGKKKKPTLVFQCEDTGPGIPVENYQYLFRPFHEQSDSECIRVDESGKIRSGVCHSKASNSGLGLFSVANQISSLGGEYGFRPRSVNSDSPKDSGAIFWFSIPLIVPILKTMTTKEDENKFKSGREGSHLCRKRLTDFDKGRHDEGTRMGNVLNTEKTRRIESAPFSIKINRCTEEEDTVLQSKRPKKSLIIDDSLVIRKSLGKAMSRMGYIVDYATNGLEGLKCLQETIYDVTFCDFLMPVMDGLDCVQQYREWEIAHRPWIKQYIIGISAHASPNDAQRGLQAGMNDFKTKPVTLVQLQEIEKGENVIELNQKLNTMHREEHFIGERSTGCETSHDYATSADSISAPLQSGPICLLGESEPSDHMRNAVSRLGWRAVQVQDGEDALRLLKVRNWDAVLIENELSRLSGIRCVARFRQWENENRIARQCNVFLLSNDIISNPGQTVTASHPKGFDGVLVRPISISTLASYLERACGINSEAADSKNIVTR